eukprot:CAMPEP_0176258688 /NCGR_PEP_ID=MMETSP0121_2-20121125/38689_1 /TAXON_ID=160619 /ORGANISM="Kryptoperidinium foliaceum, Strain CCMP 1326" /LENGTH=150 /DNA_ID=CAMNT_0017598561 /DNA_START=143 /DNA_END=594 /DNA_ORIENTATION=+
MSRFPPLSRQPALRSRRFLWTPSTSTRSPTSWPSTTCQGESKTSAVSAPPCGALAPSPLERARSLAAAALNAAEAAALVPRRAANANMRPAAEGQARGVARAPEEQPLLLLDAEALVEEVEDAIHLALLAVPHARIVEPARGAEEAAVRA